MGDVEKALRDLLKLSEEDDVVDRVRRIVTDYATIFETIKRAGVVSLVVTPQGLAHIATSRGLLDSDEGREMVERALLEAHQYLINLKYAKGDSGNERQTASG